MENNTTVEETQGVKTTEKRKASASSTVKQFRGAISNLKEAGLVNQKDYETLKVMYEKVVKQFMGEILL